MERHEFQTFVAGSLARLPGIQALEWIPRVPAAQRAAYEATAQRQGFPTFQITERNDRGKIGRATPRAEYYPVYYVEPRAGNESAMGFDLASDSLVRLPALQQARDTGRAVATARIRLVQEHGQQFGFLVYVPV